MPIRYSSKELIRIITNNGWYLVSIRGSHHKFRHKERPGIIVIPHPRNIVSTGTASHIIKTAGISTS